MMTGTVRPKLGLPECVCVCAYMSMRVCGRPCRHDDCLLTEDDDADAADTYDSDTDAAAYGGDEL